MKWLLIPFIALAITAYSGFMVVETTGDFSPSTPDNIEFWFDGEDNNGASDGVVGDDTSGDVAWQDKSGNNLDAATGTLPDYAGNVQNSKAGILFNGTDECPSLGDHADLDCQSGCTLGVVLKTAGSLAHGRIVSKQEATTGPFGWGLALPGFEAGANEVNWVIFGDSTSSTSFHGVRATDALATSTAYVVVVDYNGGTAGSTDLRIHINGSTIGHSEQAAGNSFPPDDEAAAVRLGCRNATNANFFAGHILETVFYSDLLTDGERGNLFTYFNAKWAVY